MNWLEWFKKSFPYALASLPVAGLICALVYVLCQSLIVGVGLDELDMIVLLVLASVVASMFYGIPVVFVFIAPAYALLRRLGWANWGSSLLLGITPGLAVLNWVEREIAFYSLGVGLIVGLLTHLMVSRAKMGHECGAVA